MLIYTKNRMKIMQLFDFLNHVNRPLFYNHFLTWYVFILKLIKQWVVLLWHTIKSYELHSINVYGLLHILHAVQTKIRV